jgi:hypothetical protein
MPMGFAWCQRRRARRSRRARRCEAPAEAGPVQREQQHQIAHARAVLEGERPVHVGFAGVELGVGEQAEVEPGVVQADRHGRAGAPGPEEVRAPVRVGQAQAAVLDKPAEQVR